MTGTRRCFQCNRVGTRAFKELPFLAGMDPIVICANTNACRKRWPKPLEIDE